MSYVPASRELIEDVRRSVAAWVLTGLPQPVAQVQDLRILPLVQFRSGTHHHWLRRIVPDQHVTLEEMPQACRDLMASGFRVVALGDANGKLPPEFPEGVIGARDVP